MPTRARPGPVHVVGLSCTPLLPEQDAVLDELVFDAVSAALSECALRKADVGLSVLASMDVPDGRSISSGLTTAAAAGYLSDSYRLEADSGSAVAAAAQAVAAGDVEVAVAVGVHNPEHHATDDAGRRAFLEQLSNLAFEPAFDRPVGMTAQAVYGMQAAHAIRASGVTLQDLAELSAAAITRGAAGRRPGRRSPVTAAEVLASAPVAWPLLDLMFPAPLTGAAAVVLASPARAARLLGRSAVVTGTGQATGDHTWTGDWLTRPEATTARAAADAYRNAALTDPASSVDVVELSAPTPALHGPYLRALGLSGLPPARVSPSGGLAGGHAGLANGIVRLLEAVEWLETHEPRGRAVVHSVDTVTGTVSEEATVAVVEGV
ncbi:MAG: hypothetical protein JWQ53_2616 [Klenkia sp.]|nr:hypothetical protein [Klenkia sp.]